MDGTTPHPESPQPEPPQAGNAQAAHMHPSAPGPYPQPQIASPGLPYPGPAPYGYPAMLPPPVDYPAQRSPRRAVLVGAVALVAVLVAGMIGAAIWWTSSRNDQTAAVTDASATTAIQRYLDALTSGDTETVARNNSCGFYDAVTDRRSDMTLANLTSDAFRKQFSKVSVSKIDKIVAWSPTQAQALFTLRATPAGRSQAEVERQGIAQILVDGNDLLVCSYLPRNTGQF